MILMVSLCFCSCRGCAGDGDRTAIILASTTSTDDTGLFGALVPAFEEAHEDHSVSVVAVGTGQALALGRAGDADVLLVHARSLEERFVAEGFGVERRDVMHNDFVLVGPPGDPAGVAEQEDLLSAFRVLEQGGGELVSRGDDSGTHMKESEILEAADLSPRGEWLLSVGQGMGETLTMASERQAYALSDRGTYLAMRDRLDLDVLFEKDPRLLNPYGVILTSTPKNPEGARALVDWLVSEEAREIIRGFGQEEYGQPLFFPTAR